MEYQYNLGIRFMDIARSYPERIALKYPEGEHYTYKMLNECSNQIGRFLLDKGVKKGDTIAILNEKSVFDYALMIACLKIGILYTNLDTNSPKERLFKMLTTCDPSILAFDHQQKTNEFNDSKIDLRATFLDTESIAFNKQISPFSSTDLSEIEFVHSNYPAYIMFTSGSTGFPKGAVITHSNLLNFIQWGKSTFQVGENDIFSGVNPIYFDNSVFDFYVSIFNGATLAPFKADIVKDPTNLVKYIDKVGCTIWFSVPSLLIYLLSTKSLNAHNFTNVKKFIFGGEGFPKVRLKQLYDLYKTSARFYNVYGPTECTCICSSYQVSDIDFNQMNELAPLGNIAVNFEYDLVPIDSNEQNLGELVLSGPCVGLGYYNDEIRTAAAFIRDPNSVMPQMMYKTGDLVFKDSNEQLHFKGRVDNQIKHMGYRIELEEIEAAFHIFPDVIEVCVIYNKFSEEFSRIIAFVNVKGQSYTETDMVTELRSILPVYMVPKKIVFLDILPKNSNGKIDRQKLASSI